MLELAGGLTSNKISLKTSTFHSLHTNAYTNAPCAGTTYDAFLKRSFLIPFHSAIMCLLAPPVFDTRAFFGFGCRVTATEGMKTLPCCLR